MGREDFDVIDKLRRLGVDVSARSTPASTSLRIEYPTPDVDERVITVTGTAAPSRPRKSRTCGRGPSSPARPCAARLAWRSSRSCERKTRRIARNPRLPPTCRDSCGWPAVANSSTKRGQRGRLCWPTWMYSRPTPLRRRCSPAAPTCGSPPGCWPIWAPARSCSHRDGVLVYAGGQFHEAGFTPRQLVGRTGRGDTCIAAYVARRLAAVEGRPTGSPAEATVWAAAVTSLKMEAAGPFRQDIRAVEDLIRRRYSG